MYQLGEEGPFVGAISNQQSDVRNWFVLPLRRLTAVSMKCACHPNVYRHSMSYFLLYMYYESIHKKY